MDELFHSDGEAFIRLDQDEQKLRSAWLLDTKFIAAIEKSRWGADQRWGYSIVGLNNDDTAIARLQATPSRSPATRPPAIDLAGEDEPASSTSSKPKRRSTSASSKKKRGKTKRSKVPPPPPSDSSSASEDGIGSDDNSDDYNDDLVSDDDYTGASEPSSSSNGSDDSDDGCFIDPADDSD